MIQYLIQIVYTIQHKLEEQYFKKLIINILKLRHEYHVLSEQDFQKTWIKTKKIVKDKGIKKILLNNYLFIIYRSFLGNIGLYYIYKKKNKTKNLFFISYIMNKYDFLMIQNISIIIELYNRILNKIPNNENIYLFLKTICNSNHTSTLQTNINLEIYLMFFIYNHLMTTNSSFVINKKNINDLFLKQFYNWFSQKQIHYENSIQNLFFITKKDILLTYMKQLFYKKNQINLLNSKQFIYIYYNNIYKNISFKNQWNKKLILRYDSFLYKNNTLIEIINKYNSNTNIIIKQNFKKDFLYFENINKQKTKNIYQHPYNIIQKPYIEIIKKQDQFQNKKIIWSKYKIKEISSKIITNDKTHFSYLQQIIPLFNSFNISIDDSYFKKPNIYNNEIFFYNHSYIQLITLIKIIQKSFQSNYIITIETKENLNLLTKMLSLNNINWYLFFENNFNFQSQNINNKMIYNNKKKNIIITRPNLQSNLYYILKKNNINYTTITTELLQKQIKLEHQQIYLLHWNKLIVKHISNDTDTKIITNSSHKIVNKTLSSLQQILNQNTNKTTILNKELLKEISTYYIVRYIHKFLTDIQTISQKELSIYNNHLKTIYLQNTYTLNNTQIKTNYFSTLNEIIINILNENNLNKYKNIKFLNIHIQKKIKQQNKKQDYKKKVTSLHYQNYYNDIFSYNILLLNSHFINLVSNLKKNIDNNNQKVTKNDEYLFSLQIIQIYKNFIYELLLINTNQKYC